MKAWNKIQDRDNDGKFTYKNGGATSDGSKEKSLSRADILYPTMVDKEQRNNNIKSIGNYKDKNLSREDIRKENDGIFTGAAASIVTDEIAGVKKGKPMSLEDAIKDVNPNYTWNGNQTYTTNCQASVIVADARVRGFNLNVDIEYESEFKNQLSKRPNIAYIDPKTGKTPEFTNIKVSNEVECETFLNNTVKQNERYFFGFTWKSSSNKYISHILLAVKDENNKIKFYDPQNNKTYNALLLREIKYKFNWKEEYNPPAILRVDDKDLNLKILNKISRPAEKRKIRYYIPKNY